MAVDLNQLTQFAGNFTNLLTSLNKPIIILLLIFAIIPIIFSVLIASFIGRYKKAVLTSNYLIPLIVQVMILIVLFLMYYNFPEIFSSIIGGN